MNRGRKKNEKEEREKKKGDGGRVSVVIPSLVLGSGLTLSARSGFVAIAAT